MIALRAKAGDRKALDEFIASTCADVVRLCRYLGHPSDPEDLAQETYVRAMGALHRFRGDGPARAWLLTIARRVCVDATRRAVRGREMVARLDADTYRGPLHDVSWYEVDELLADLDEDRREAFVLTQLVGLSYEEAAAVAECPIGTIRSRVARARRQLLDDDGVSEALGA